MGSGRGLQGVREGHHKGLDQEQAWRPPQGRREGQGAKGPPEGQRWPWPWGKAALGLLSGGVSGGQGRV